MLRCKRTRGSAAGEGEEAEVSTTEEEEEGEATMEEEREEEGAAAGEVGGTSAKGIGTGTTGEHGRGPGGEVRSGVVFC